MARRSTPTTTDDTTTTAPAADDTTTETDDTMTDTTTDDTTTDDATTAPVVHDTIGDAVDAFIGGDADAIQRHIGTLAGGARTAASGRAVQHMLATGADPADIGAVATAVTGAVESLRTTGAAVATMTDEQATAAHDHVVAWLTMGADLLALVDGLTDLQTDAIRDALTRASGRVNVTTGQRRTIARDWSTVARRVVTLTHDGTTHRGTMQTDGTVRVDGQTAPESLSAAACRITGQKSVRGTTAWVLNDGAAVGDAAAI